MDFFHVETCHIVGIKYSKINALCFFVNILDISGKYTWMEYEMYGTMTFSRQLGFHIVI